MHGITARIFDSKLRIRRKTVEYRRLYALASFLKYSCHFVLEFQRDCPCPPKAPDVTDGQTYHEVHQDHRHQNQEQGEQELRQPEVVLISHDHVHEVKLPQ